MTGGRISGTLILFLLCLALPARAGAETILVINSADLNLYNRAVGRIVPSFREDRGEHVTVLSLADIRSGKAAPPEHPDVVIPVGAAATRYAAETFPDRPMVYCMVMHPERIELPPGAIGISMFVPVADMLATLTLISPNIHHVGVILGPEHRDMVQAAQEKLIGYETTLIPVEIDDERDLPKLARRLVLQSDALWIVPGALSSREAYRFLLKLSFEHRVPLVGDSPALVRAGALFAVTPDPESLGEQAARLAGYRIEGEPLPDTPLLYPDMANFSVNLKTAKSLGIKVPPLMAAFASLRVE